MAAQRPDRSEVWLLRGKLFTLRRRCGTLTCRCVVGEEHQSPALAYPQGGRTKTLTLAEAEVAEVAAGLARYAAERAELDARAEAGLVGLLERVARRRQGRPR